MNEIQVKKNENVADTQMLSSDIKLEIIEEGIRKKYLSRLTEMQIVPAFDMKPLEEEIIESIRLYKITEMVYQKGESAVDKFTTVFNTLATYNSTAFIIMDSDGKTTDFYIGVRNNEPDESLKRSTVTLGDTLKNTFIGHFPGVKIKNEDRKQIQKLCEKVRNQHNVASVSVVGNNKLSEKVGEQFVQGLEKLALAMYGRQFIGIIVAENQSPQMIEILRRSYQNLYTQLSPLQKTQISENSQISKSRNKSFTEMDGKQKAVMIANAAVSLAGVIGGVACASASGGIAAQSSGAIIGGQIAGQFNGFISSLAPVEQISESTGTSTSTTAENKTVTDLLCLLDESLKRTNEFDSYGMWNVAGYFASDDMSTAEIAASNYRSLMNGENSGREVSAINSWRSNNPALNGNYYDLTAYLSRFIHPRFFYDSTQRVLVDASTAISGKELGLHLGLPRATVPGLPVIEHAEFGKEVTTYSLFKKKTISSPEERLTLGKVFDLGQITDKIVELDAKSLNMHTFITGSTGSGKSNTVYQILCELHHDHIPFLVVEPAKGEYKDVFGGRHDVNVYSTNPNIAELINLNPFMFPDAIHVLEHVDGLVEIFSVCWPMYDAMPAFFKDAILKSYEAVGWDLCSSTFDGDEPEYPDFEILTEKLDELISHSDYASDIKSNYRGALITRVKSLTVGLNKFIFTNEQTPYAKLFDENCILDISRIKSSETKALIMGLVVYILNEYRVDRKKENNNDIKHVTVLEEAHNLLKNSSAGNESAIIAKSVEMLTQTIAEIRTYGEGFIIVDQSPSSVDISAIKNTNTKIVLRTPEANDREAIGRSIGLTENQVNEIAKLPSGVAVVYQNDWISPVLTMIDKANVTEALYVNENKKIIKPIKVAKTEIISMLMQPWFKHSRMPGVLLRDDLTYLEIPRKEKRIIKDYIDDYVFCGGKLVWSITEIPILQRLLKTILSINDQTFKEMVDICDPYELRRIVDANTFSLSESEINEICNILTKVAENYD